MLFEENRIFNVYVLTRPDLPDPFYIWKDQPFYVGKGCGERMYFHRYEARTLLRKSGKPVFQ